MKLIPDDTWAILTIWMEARGESDAGKLAVAEVIRNRTAAKFFSKGTVASTVLWPYQFSGWNTKDHNRTPAAELDTQDSTYQACYDAWEAAKKGANTVHGALNYYNPNVIPSPPAWALPNVATFTAQVGNHYFYRPLTVQV